MAAVKVSAVLAQAARIVVLFTLGGHMVKKLKKLSAEKATSAHTGAQLAQSVKDSAQQIWLAGLGAFSKEIGRAHV